MASALQYRAASLITRLSSTSAANEITLPNPGPKHYTETGCAIGGGSLRLLLRSFPEPPSYLVQEDIPDHAPERAVQSATAQWLIAQGVNPVTAVSSEGAKPVHATRSGGKTGRAQDPTRAGWGAQDDADVEDAQVIDDGEDFFS